MLLTGLRVKYEEIRIFSEKSQDILFYFLYFLYLFIPFYFKFLFSVVPDIVIIDKLTMILITRRFPMEKNFKATINACFTGYIVQAIVNNFVPLLFLTFQSGYGIPLTKITLFITINFAIQLLIDLCSVKFVDRIGYRTCMLIAHGCAFAGVILLTILPDVLPDPFIGLLIAIVIYAVGGGLLEVLVSPIMESCPTANKEKAMSLLHSFYCWGHVAVVLLSTIFFTFVGIEHWKIMALLWAIVPLCNGILFLKVPIAPLIEEGEEGLSLSQLVKNKFFWILFLMMLCAGASEQAVSQWASTFAEQGLGVTKTIGDLAGPMAFAILMGSARAFYGKFGDRIDLNRFMAGSTILCILSYLCISLSPNPVFSLIGCGLCGLSVGILWPGTFSKASVTIRNGGTAMFALLALAGDVGCSGGPTLVGFCTGLLNNDLHRGILMGIVFPICMLVCISVIVKKHAKADYETITR